MHMFRRRGSVRKHVSRLRPRRMWSTTCDELWDSGLPNAECLRTPENECRWRIGSCSRCLYEDERSKIAMSVAARMVHGSVVTENAACGIRDGGHRTKTVIAARVKVGNGSVQNSFVTTLAHRMSAGLWNQWLNSAMMGAPVDRHVA